MPFLLMRNDITRVAADAIVNPANTRLREGSGTSRAIYLAAGEAQLERACEKIGYCEPGRAVITEGFGLPARYIIHAVGPVWQNGEKDEERILYSAYREAMKLAREWRLESLAFPLLSSGSYGYPKEHAFSVAVSAITDFLKENEMTVYLVLYDSGSLAVGRKLFDSVKEYIDEHYVAGNDGEYRGHFAEELGTGGWEPPNQMPSLFQAGFRFPQAAVPAASYPAPAASRDRSRQLEDIMKHMGETFSQMLLRLIDERGLTDPQVYHKANIDRKLFSKIRTNRDYSPNKKTVMAFAVALELSPDEARDLLRTAGYTFSDSSRFDVIIRFFLEKGIYDIFEINEMLFYYEQPLLGG